MNTITANDVEAIEDTLRSSSPSLRNQLKVDVASAHPAICEEDSDARITLYAKVEMTGQSTGVVKVAQYAARDLYPFSDGPRLRFSDRLHLLRSKVETLLSTDEQDIDFDIQATDVLKTLMQLRDLHGTSPQHDEVISTYLMFVHSFASSALPRDAAVTLLRTLKSLEPLVHFPDETLDRVVADMEAIGVDFGAPFQAHASK